MRIEGWFTCDELSLLSLSLRLAVARAGQHQAKINAVETGSYKGHSTIAMGLTIVAWDLNAIIYAVDPHTGFRSGRGDRLRHDAPTYDAFMPNLTDFGLQRIVRCVRAPSTETSIDFPITFLLVDGIHTYDEVRADFEHSEDKLTLTSLIV